MTVTDSGSAAVWGSKRINPRSQFCLCLTWNGCPSNDDDDKRQCITENCIDFKVICYHVLKKFLLLNVVQNLLLFQTQTSTKDSLSDTV